MADPRPEDHDEDHDERVARWLPRIQKAVIVVSLALLVAMGGFVLGERSASPPDSEVDVGFLHDMTNHHEQAVQMAAVAVVTATDPVVREFAKEVLITQQRELGLMEAFLEARGEERLGADREGMAWMDMAMPVSEMPGMATEEQMDALLAAEGAEADVLFLELMREHHRGGLHMASDASERAAAGEVRHLASVMARNQAAEVQEYTAVLDRLRSS